LTIPPELCKSVFKWIIIDMSECKNDLQLQYALEIMVMGCGFLYRAMCLLNTWQIQVKATTECKTRAGIVPDTSYLVYLAVDLFPALVLQGRVTSDVDPIVSFQCRAYWCSADFSMKCQRLFGCNGRNLVYSEPDWIGWS
jgi:hypothetical protein